MTLKHSNLTASIIGIHFNSDLRKERKKERKRKILTVFSKTIVGSSIDVAIVVYIERPSK